MKNILFILTSLVLTVCVKAQYPINQSLGSDSTLVISKGGFKARLVNYSFTDTMQANTQRIKQYAGAFIYTSSDNGLWLRDLKGTKWISVSSGTSGNTTIYNIYNNSTTGISIINQGDSSVTISICTGSGVCDTTTLATNVTYKIGASVSFIDSSHISICGTDSSTLEYSCDTLSVPVQHIYVFQNGLQQSISGVVELGGNIVHNTTLASGYNTLNFIGNPIYSFPFKFSQNAATPLGAAITSFKGRWNGGVGGTDNNLVKLGIQYTNDTFSISPLYLGYYGSRTGYLFGTNLTPSIIQGSPSIYSMSLDDVNSKYSGVFLNTKDTANNEAGSLFGAPPTYGTGYIHNLDTTKALVWKTNKDLQFPNYPSTRDDGVLTKVLGTDASGNVILGTPNQGASGGTYIISGLNVVWDSLLTFDVTAGTYMINGVLYHSNFTVVTLDTLIGTDPRRDQIIADTLGVVSKITGTPSSDPAAPTPNPLSQIGITDVLINAGDNVPANVTQGFIYNEGTGTAGGEWDTASSISAARFRNTAHPYNGTYDLYVPSFTNKATITFTNNTTVDLSAFTSVSYAIRLNSAFSAIAAYLSLRWYNGNTAVSNAINVGTGNYGWVRTTINNYQHVAVPMSAFTFSSYTANKLVITLAGSNSSGFYFDYLQLQSNVGQPPAGNGLIGLQVANFSPLFNSTTTITNNLANVTYSAQNATAYRVFGNFTNTSAAPTFGQIDLGTSVVTGLLPVTNLSVAPANYYLGSLDGITNQWLPLASLYDSAYVKNWLRTKNGAVRDTIVFGSPYQDSALLSYDTYVGLNTHAFHIQQGATDFLLIDPINYISDILQNDGTSESAIEIDANTSGTVRANLYAYNGTNQASILADANSNIISLDVAPPGGNDLAKITLSGNDSTVSIFGALVISAFTPANSTDSTYPIQTLTSDDTYIYYRKSNGTWVKIAWTAF